MRTKSLELQGSRIVGYYCECNSYNDILTAGCWNCQKNRPSNLAVISLDVALRRSGCYVELEYLEIDDGTSKHQFLTESEKKMTSESKELHADFFAKWQDEARSLASLYDDEALTAWRNELATIALKGKVFSVVADEEIKARKAKKAAEGKPWLVSSSDKNIGNVTSRKTRMSKEEKLRNMMEELGVANAGSIVKNLSDEKLNKFKVVKSSSDSESSTIKVKDDIDLSSLDFLR